MTAGLREVAQTKWRRGAVHLLADGFASHDDSPSSILAFGDSIVCITAVRGSHASFVRGSGL
jgi:hypothetical protein